MLNSVKKALRITTSDFDDDIYILIEACKYELKSNGVNFEDLRNCSYINLAIINFCKAHFGNNPDSDKYIRVYENLKGYLMGVKNG